MLQTGVSAVDVSRTFNCSRNTVRELVIRNPVGAIHNIRVAFAWSTHDNAKWHSDITKWHPTIANDGDQLKQQCRDTPFKMSPIKARYLAMSLRIVEFRIALSLCHFALSRCHFALSCVDPANATATLSNGTRQSQTMLDKAKRHFPIVTPYVACRGFVWGSTRAYFKRHATISNDARQCEATF
jgi:hypothetical protein